MARPAGLDPAPRLSRPGITSKGPESLAQPNGIFRTASRAESYEGLCLPRSLHLPVLRLGGKSTAKLSCHLWIDGSSNQTAVEQSASWSICRRINSVQAGARKLEEASNARAWLTRRSRARKRAHAFLGPFLPWLRRRVPAGTEGSAALPAVVPQASRAAPTGGSPHGASSRPVE
jgi:hypothetical protein